MILVLMLGFFLAGLIGFFGSARRLNLVLFDNQFGLPVRLPFLMNARLPNTVEDDENNDDDLAIDDDDDDLIAPIEDPELEDEHDRKEDEEEAVIEPEAAPILPPPPILPAFVVPVLTLDREEPAAPPLRRSARIAASRALIPPVLRRSTRIRTRLPVYYIDMR
jgi:hypothetical protein